MSTDNRLAFTARSAAAAYRVSRHRIAAAIKAGELPAQKLGRRTTLICRADLDAWIRQHAIRITSHAEQRAAEMLARTEQRGA